MANVQPVTPLLEEGQRLSRDEFLRRWDAMPELKRAELIDGVVYMPSPVSLAHSAHDFTVSGWLFAYSAATPGCQGGNNGTWLMEERSAPQPDSFLCVLPEYGGQFRLEDEYPAGAPELAVEVMKSRRSYDLGVKLKLYERAGVQEYLTVILKDQRVVWRVLEAGSYIALPTAEDGILRSRVFPGLWLHAQAALDGDGTRVLATLHEGLATPEHADFVRRLEERGPGPFSNGPPIR